MKNTMLNKLYQYRFELFFFSQIAILFGSLLFPSDFFENILSPVLFLMNLGAGILLIAKNKKLMWFFVMLLVFSVIFFGIEVTKKQDTKFLDFLDMGIYFLFYVVVTFEIIKQIWGTKIINKNVIFGLMSGYISLGLIGFFICISIEMAYPGSFEGLNVTISQPEILTERLMYYSYITLLTIGYGEIVPVSILAQKAAVLIGMMGQFYLVILTAIIVGKYINQQRE
ncbi:ion channel [Aquimarina algiphila]|uniref:ion channel n=1 Tax=Aquimarina algiphila TaxID=2047982 RepID=UPI00232D979E|nr:ion channel [Aquimarina algiphila]